MPMNSYILDNHLRGIEFHSKKLADQIGLKQLLEKQTGLSFSTYLSDRRAAYRLKMAVKEWLWMECRQYLDAFPYEEAEMTREQVLNDATARIYWDLVCQEYGRARAIAIRNKILPDFSIRGEFFAEGEAASSRDFSYLLDQVDAKPNPS